MHAARREIAALLKSMGYIVTEHPFRCGPGRLEALPLTGTGLTFLALILAPLLFAEVNRWAALAVYLTGGAAIAGLALRTGLGQPPLERSDANLIAARPAAAPRIWIVAHLDTKAQRQSMLGRLVAIWISIAVVVAAGVAVAVRLGGPLSAPLALGCGALLLLAGALLGRGRLEGQTAGACDNGSGIVALLSAAEHARGDAIGFIVTSAEEFGMLGAEAMARERATMFPGCAVVNFDTIDDAGALYVVRHDNRSEPLARLMVDLLKGLAPSVRERRLPMGILTDSLPLSRVAAGTVTVGRLDRRTLGRMHTPGDAPGTCGYQTARLVGAAVAGRFDPVLPGD